MLAFVGGGGFKSQIFKKKIFEGMSSEFFILFFKCV